MFFVYKKVTIAAALAAAVIFLAFGRPAGAQDADEKLYVVTHVDVLGQTGAAEAAKILHQFAADSRSDQGSVRFEVLRDSDRLNHFTIVEVWRKRCGATGRTSKSHLAARPYPGIPGKVTAHARQPFRRTPDKLLP
jgi:quinol monooxygenase YgiN